MPLKFWDEAFLAATFLINRTPSRAIHYQTPLEWLYHINLNYSSLLIFGAHVDLIFTPIIKESLNSAPKSVCLLDIAICTNVLSA
jgi:hypothetical protein